VRTVLTRHPRAPLMVWGTVCTVAFLGLLLPLPYLAELQAANFELMLRLHQAMRPTEPVPGLAVVAIDEAAERFAGRSWPWTKAQLARALEALRAEGARTVVVQGLFRDAQLATVTAADPLGEVIGRGGGVILPARPGLAVPGALTGGEVTGDVDGMTQLVRLWEPDKEGPKLTWTGHAVAAALGGALGETRGAVAVGPRRMTVGGREVVLRDGYLRVNPALYPGVKRVSLGAVLAGTLERGALKDRVVLMGPVGAAWPAVALTPSQLVAPVELHALAVATALTGTPIKRTSSIVTGLLVVLTLLYTVPIVWAPRSRRALMVAKVGTVLILLPAFAVHWAFVEVDVARPIVMFLIALPATAALRMFAPVTSPPEPEGETRGRDEEPVGGEPVDADVMLELVRKYLGDRFERLEEIGHGGMGSVFRARCRRLGTDVALKVMHPQHARERELVERFHREFELGEALAHPGFVRVFERGRAGLHWFTMELVAAKTLRQELDAGTRLSARDGAELLRELAGAMRFAHARGVLHRDLKPGNVMRAAGGVKVLDLGVARVAEATALTRSGAVMGTLRYMPPEQIDGRPMDPRTDVFSAAVVVFEACTGELPYDPYDLTRQLRVGIAGPGGPLGELLAACLNPDPEARPENFEAVMDSLNKFETTGTSGA
jgi:CHASE2 domain-containing sensor protein